MMKVAPPPLADIEQPRPPRPVEAFDRESELRGQVRDGRLTLIPILAEEDSGPSYLTLQEGMASGEVRAIDSGLIEAITVTNRSSRPLLILGGELVVGGHQDRLTTRNTVIPAHRTQSVATVCAELGRSEGPDAFRGAVALAEPTLRALVRGAGDQFAIWERISALTGTISDSYRHVQQRKGVNADRLRHLLAGLDTIDRREERSKTVGFAVALDDKVIAIERFASPSLFRAVREMVIASYLPSSVGKSRTEGVVGANDVRAFKERTGAGGQVPPRNPAAAPSAARSTAP